MECTCKVNQRRLLPAVFNLKQYLNSTETMVWTLDNTITNNGECDLCDYDAFLVMTAKGEIDEVMLVKQKDENGTLKLLWNVGKNATKLKDTVRYQIVFRRSAVEEIGVWGSADPAANGIYAIDSYISEDINRVFTNKYSGYVMKWNIDAGSWAIFDTAENLVETQTIRHLEPYCGGWQNVIVSNNTAAAWYSDEAVMFISETIAADQSITANFPTVLRQMWEAVKNMILRSGTAVFEKEISVDDWQGSTSPYQLNASIAEIPQGSNIVNIRLLKITESGVFSDVSNITYTQDETGNVVVYCHEKIDGKLTVTVKGGNDYVFVEKEAVAGSAATIEYVDKAVENKASKDHTHTGYAATEHTHKAADINGLSKVATSGSYNDLSDKPTIPTVNYPVTSVNGKTGAVTITVPTKTSDLNNDSGFVAKSYVDGQIGNINSILDTINGEVI